MRICGLAAAMMAGLSMAGVALADTPVFINELHYDNAGTDTGERVEVAGPVGTDLSGWSIVLYNGKYGTTYDTINLSGTIPASHVVVGVPPLGQIQNGSKDGLALVDNTGTVVQLLSYEGIFTATDGPANGMTSVDIGVYEPSNTPAGQSLQLTGSGSVYEDFTWTGPSTDTFGAANTGQTFTGGGGPTDTSPSIASTAPADGATGVALAASIDIHFDEAVTTAANWVAVSCTSSGTHTLAISGSGADYTLHPFVAFDYSETCIVTIDSTAVTDLDGTTNDPMAADYQFSFQTEAQTGVDLAPEVVMTTPDNTASAWPADNILVRFSEAVSVGPGWYTLSCTQSGSHSARTHAGPYQVNFMVGPDEDFVDGESCTFTIVASAVQDMDGTPDAMAADKVVTFTVDASTAYYTGVDTSDGPALEAWLHNRIKNHDAHPYSSGSTDTWDIIADADQDPNNPDNIIDIYQNMSVAKMTGGQGPYNREHTWPNSLGFKHKSMNGQPNPPYTDVHMLYASDVQYNSDRGNKPYDYCTSGCTRLATDHNDGLGGGSAHGDANWYKVPDGNQGSFEVWDHRKGDAARAVMYMAVRYDGGINGDGQVEPDLQLTDNRSLIVATDAQTGTGGVAYMGILSTLLEWNELDPPDVLEKMRNGVVASYQGNRNPFIDHPEWARCVFEGTNCPGDSIFEDGFEEKF